jgi:L-fuculose-phosphate aldolase
MEKSRTGDLLPSSELLTSTQSALMKTERQLKRQIVQVCRMLHLKNLIAATDGNVSARLGDRLLTTPSRLNKGFLEEDQIITVDLEGRLLAGKGRPTSELEMHLLVYRLRPEVAAVVHAHPPLVTAFSVAGISLEEFILPEVVLSMGVVPTASYATPTTREVPESIRDLIRGYDALILERHGAVTAGLDIIDAYNKMEKLEHMALVILTAMQLGGVRLLPPREVEKLIQLKVIQGLKLPQALNDR